MQLSYNLLPNHRLLHADYVLSAVLSRQKDVVGFIL